MKVIIEIEDSDEGCDLRFTFDPPVNDKTKVTQASQCAMIALEAIKDHMKGEE